MTALWLNGWPFLKARYLAEDFSYALRWHFRRYRVDEFDNVYTLH